MRIRTQCRSCGYPFRARITPGENVVCPQCQDERQVRAEAWDPSPPASVSECPLCECRHLYRQRDINRGLGCVLIIIGAIFVPWTYGLSLVGLSLVDLWLYRRLKNAVVCYRCDTVYRDAVPTRKQGDFDLLKHDVLKYGKTWSEEANETIKP